MENKAYAKINLTLDVLAKRGDGFHELATIMRAVDVFDELSIAFGGEEASVIAEPPLPMENAALRAARAYMEAGGTAGARITIKRGIPEEAGLGGSSADAAAVLRAMQAHYGALGEEELFAIALSIGSDVPFCLAGGSALCLGRGERMTKLPDISLPLLIAKPKAGVSTAKLFSLLSPPYMPPRSMEAAEAVRAGDAAALCGCVSNALRGAASSLVPEIADYIDRMERAGALAAEMTGSGSAVFGLFSSEAGARAAMAAFPDAAFLRPAHMI